MCVFAYCPHTVTTLVMFFNLYLKDSCNLRSNGSALNSMLIFDIITGWCLITKSIPLSRQWVSSSNISCSCLYFYHITGVVTKSVGSFCWLVTVGTVSCLSPIYWWYNHSVSNKYEHPPLWPEWLTFANNVLLSLLSWSLNNFTWTLTLIPTALF